MNRDIQDGTLDDWKLTDVTYVLDSFSDVAEDLNYRCDLSLTGRLVDPQIADRVESCAAKAWNDLEAFSRLAQDEKRKYLDGECP